MNKIVKSFTIVTIFSVATRLLSFLFKIWMSRSLGAEVVGMYQISLSVLMLLFTLTAGAPTVLSRKIAEAIAVGDTKRQHSLTTASILIGLATASTLCIIFYSINNKLTFIFADPRCIEIFLMMLPALLTSSLYAPIRSWFWGQKKFLAFSSTEFIDEVFKIIFSMIFAGSIVSSISGAKGVALAFVLSDVICVFILLLLYFKSGGKFAKPTGFKELLVSTVPLSATRITTTLTSSLTAIIVPQRLIASGYSVAMATASFGRIAGMALPLMMAPITIIASLSVVLTPDIAELSSKNELEQISRKLRNCLSFALIVSAVFFVIYLPLGQQLGYLLFGDREAGKFVSYCAVLLFPISLSQVTTPILNSLGMEKTTFCNAIIGSVMIVPCIFFLPQYIGVYAIAVGLGCFFLTVTTLNFFALHKKLGNIINLKKTSLTVVIAVILALFGVLCSNIATPLVGEMTSILLLGTFLIFFLFIFLSAFKIVDVQAYLPMLSKNQKIIGDCTTRQKTSNAYTTKQNAIESGTTKQNTRNCFSSKQNALTSSTSKHKARNCFTSKQKAIESCTSKHKAVESCTSKHKARNCFTSKQNKIIKQANIWFSQQAKKHKISKHKRKK